MGEYRQRVRRGEPPEVPYDEHLLRDYWDPEVRAARLDDLGADTTVVFPDFGRLWERPSTDRPDVQLANMAAWNRWAVEVAQAAGRRLHPVAHRNLRFLLRDTD